MFRFEYFAFLLLLTLVSCSSHNSNSNIGTNDKLSSYEDVYKKLTKVREKRQEELEKYLLNLLKQANSVQQDEFMKSFFKMEKKYTEIKKNKQNISENLSIELKKTELSALFHHIKHYDLFYDILFIDTDGNIFHTILKDSDYGKSLSKQEYSKTALANKIKNNPLESFVDFQYYISSEKPSSFFVEPAKDSTGIIGWFAFQVSINKLNNILSTNYSDLNTCEVLLVNKSQYMLNNSRFSIRSTILKQKIPYENLLFKFRENEGTGIVVDYRGQPVLTSFKIFTFMKTDWLITAKVDEEEILTKIYEQNSKKYSEIITQPIQFKDTLFTDSIKFNKDVLRVDMDEFQRTDSTEILYTKSIHTCTGVLLYYPEKFAYLAHISPADRVYLEEGTDLISQIFRQIDEKEIIKMEKRNLEIIIVSPKDDAICEIVKLLIEHGIFLSQIKVLFNPLAIYADMSYDLEKNNTQVFWKLNSYDKTFQLQFPKNVNSLNLKFQSVSNEF